MKLQIAEKNQKPSFTKPTRGNSLKMDIVLFGSTVVPKSNRTKDAEKRKSLK